MAHLVLEPHEIYKKAAKLILDYEKMGYYAPFRKYSCYAIRDIVLGNSWIYEDQYEKWFKPEDISWKEERNTGWFGSVMDDDNQLARINALLLMAEIAKTEDLK